MKPFPGWKPSFVKYTISLNEQAREGNLDPVAGRDSEINQLTTILSRRTKNNPLLIGEPGIGKTAVVEGLVQKIIAGNVPKSLLNKVILQLDFGSLTAGARQKGEFEERLRELLSDLSSSHEVILFIDDAHVLLENSKDHGNAAAVLKKYLDHNLITIIGATNDDMYKKYFDTNKTFERDFQPVRIEEPNEEKALGMLQSERQKYEQYHNVFISDEILAHALALSIKHIPSRMLPDKALDLIDEAAAHVKLLLETGKRKTNRIRKDDIDKVIADWTGIPVARLTNDESKKLLMLEKLIHKRIAGQEHAVTAVSEAIRRGRIGLGSSSRPVASFLFCGPSGVGKSELVKVLNRILHETENTLVQLDMSEYMEKENVSKLIGAPPGYVGYEEGGILTEAVSRQPASIILFDNIEKAHPDISNILLQILEEGHLTDSKGKTVSFKNAVVVCVTTNGHQAIKKKIQASSPEVKEQDIVREEMAKMLRPEIVNRFDSLVNFYNLTPENMNQISRILVSDVASSLKKQGYILQVTESTVLQLAKAGYSADEGARPLRKVITEVIENPVAMAIISRKFKQGDTLLAEFNAARGFTISNSASEILASTKISLPRIKDIAEYDKAVTKKEQTKQQEIESIVGVLKKLAKMDSITDPAEKAQLEQIKQLLMAEKEKGNPTADVIWVAVESFSEGNAALPQVNVVQVVSDEDFEEVRVIWKENYLDRDASGNAVEAQSEYVKKEMESTAELLKLLTSTNPADKENALRSLVTILPMILIGGFTEEQIIKYLEVKTQAAKEALDILIEEEETLLSVKKPIQKTQKPAYQSQTV